MAVEVAASCDPFPILLEAPHQSTAGIEFPKRGVDFRAFPCDNFYIIMKLKMLSSVIHAYRHSK